jgi:8-oxo-dGTP diphosphatase
MCASRRIEVLARGVYVKKGKLLVCHSAGAENTYLPGGHVEFEESASVSLAREIKEELGMKATVGRFLGAVEHTFIQRGERHCEINLVFEMKIKGLDPSALPASKEGHIDFRWVALGGVANASLEPRVLARKLRKWLDPSSREERWAGTY